MGIAFRLGPNGDIAVPRNSEALAYTGGILSVSPLTTCEAVWRHIPGFQYLKLSKYSSPKYNGRGNREFE